MTPERRFRIITRLEDTTSAPSALVIDWTAELKHRLGPERAARK